MAGYGLGNLSWDFRRKGLTTPYNLIYNSCSLSFPPCHTSQEIWTLSKSFTSSPGHNLVGSGGNHPARWSRETRQRLPCCLIPVLGRALAALVESGGSDSDGEGAHRSPPFSSPARHVSSMAVCGSQTCGGSHSHSLSALKNGALL